MTTTTQVRYAAATATEYRRGQLDAASHCTDPGCDYRRLHIDRAMAVRHVDGEYPYVVCVDPARLGVTETR